MEDERRSSSELRVHLGGRSDLPAYPLLGPLLPIGLTVARLHQLVNVQVLRHPLSLNAGT